MIWQKTGFEQRRATSSNVDQRRAQRRATSSNIEQRRAQRRATSSNAERTPQFYQNAVFIHYLKNNP